MAAKVRRKFKLPVFSRLTLAWGGAFTTAAMIVAIALAPMLTGANETRISLPVDDIELMARAAPAQPETDTTTGGLRLAAPGFKEPPSAEFDLVDSGETLDRLAYPDDFDVANLNETDPDADEPLSPEDFVITIAGSNRPAISASAASLQASRIRAVPNPDPNLLRDTPFGKIPIPAPDGRIAMHYYRNSFDGGDGAPTVSLILGGLGLNKALTERAIDELPPEISLSFAPYAKDLEFWTEKARKAGHEVLIELPMENYSGDPSALGAAGLLTSRSSAENLQRLDWLMSRFGGYFAATNYQGGKFAADDDAMAPILTKLTEAGVGYIDDTGAASALAAQTGASVASVTRVLPPAPDDSARLRIKRELNALEKLAKRDGGALAKAYAFSATIDEIAEWSQGLERKDVALAPASAALPQRRASR